MNASGKTETKILSFSHDYGTFKSFKLAALTLSAYDLPITGFEEDKLNSSFADSLAKTILQKLNGEVEHRGRQHKVALDFFD